MQGEKGGEMEKPGWAAGWAGSANLSRFQGRAEAHAVFEVKGGRRNLSEKFPGVSHAPETVRGIIHCGDFSVNSW
jgi:hypothetical protein